LYESFDLFVYWIPIICSYTNKGCFIIKWFSNKTIPEPFDQSKVIITIENGNKVAKSKENNSKQYRIDDEFEEDYNSNDLDDEVITDLYDLIEDIIDTILSEKYGL
jgi:hypothetical protein